ncbi:uncharacterized protein BCR38DRAFT_79595 [Pseudomassariella vexata]|uniref:Uncharacterized protein n=1 Tax=Pseudomassariella vexata TaxID=1141098 RepID=A0A1Y2DES0_9PEZI|nr:uncharacterized protein BCR38DRAFT_79595 [Pseudomassariella vexata]ORY57739.1 hypothetical protein BCR38DRAFT_79595 [Pseudomassariella vexata]
MNIRTSKVPVVVLVNQSAREKGFEADNQICSETQLIAWPEAQKGSPSVQIYCLIGSTHETFRRSGQYDLISPGDSRLPGRINTRAVASKEIGGSATLGLWRIFATYKIRHRNPLSCNSRRSRDRHLSRMLWPSRCRPTHLTCRFSNGGSA